MISAPRPARASAIASSLGIVYCTPRRTPGTRRTASEWPCERPLPQNVFVTAVRYDAGLRVSKDTILVTTIVAIPAMIAVALLLA